MKVCVLQPDYSGSSLEFRHYDPPRDLSPLLPESQVDHLFLKKTATHRQLREAAARGYDIFVNLCSDYFEWDVPAVDAGWSLEALELPFTGSAMRLYDPSKALMKYVAYTRGVRFPDFAEVRSGRECRHVLEFLRFPLFVKPAHSGDSFGIDRASYVTTEEELVAKASAIVREFGSAIVEEFVPGREFTVLVAATPGDPFAPLVLKPLEFVFPPGERFKTYELKTTEHHPEANVPVTEPDLDRRLKEATRDVFVGFEGDGYARLDFRIDRGGEICLLDVNFLCSIFYPPGYEGSADYILKYDPIGPSGFLRHIIAEGLHRHQQRRRCFERRGRALSGFGIFATEDIRKGGLVMAGEGHPHRLITRRHVEKHWPPEQAGVFRQYAIPANARMNILWDEAPEKWAPQNHSCDPNTGYSGLDLVALRDIRVGEELTFDHGAVYDDSMPPFECRCGSPLCRGVIRGKPGNTILGPSREEG